MVPAKAEVIKVWKKGISIEYWVNDSGYIFEPRVPFATLWQGRTFTMMVDPKDPYRFINPVVQGRALAFAGLCIIFVMVGISVFVMTKRAKQRFRMLRTHGVCRQGIVKSVQMDLLTSTRTGRGLGHYNRLHPWFVTVECRHPRTQKMITVKSDLVMMIKLRVGDQVDVLFDPSDDSIAVVDVERTYNPQRILRPNPTSLAEVSSVGADAARPHHPRWSPRRIYAPLPKASTLLFSAYLFPLILGLILVIVSLCIVSSTPTTPTGLDSQLVSRGLLSDQYVTRISTMETGNLILSGRVAKIWEPQAICLCTVGAVLMLVALYAILRLKFKLNRLEALRQSGIRQSGVVTKIHWKLETAPGSRLYYLRIAEVACQHPVTGEKITVKSLPLTTSSVNSGDRVTVLFDRTNDKIRMVDLTDL
ncbi:MAG: hypothetical protein IKK21_00605 [Clostridia bacterium]|nr:hypothetical protein [Clostridia bacterium]